MTDGGARRQATADAGGSQTKSDRDYYMAIYATWVRRAAAADDDLDCDSDYAVLTSSGCAHCAAQGGAGLILIILRAIMIATVRIRAARVLHERLVERVLRLPVAFFESRPIGACRSAWRCCGLCD